MRPVKLLLDENLSPAVAQKLQREGFDVVHVRDRGLLAGTDAEVLDKAFHEDRIAVTLNVGDFVLLAGAAEVQSARTSPARALLAQTDSVSSPSSCTGSKRLGSHPVAPAPHLSA